MSISKNILSNPYISLMRIAWRYAKEEKAKFISTYVRFAISNLFHALEPIIWGLFINEVQKQGAQIIYSSWVYVGAYLLIRLIDWFFHGIARVKERELAFHMSQNFLKELYHKAVHLPITWHQDNHSGATINRIRKAYEGLKYFFSDGYEYIHTFFSFVISFAAVVYFAPLYGGIAFLFGVLMAWVVLKFDKPIIETLDQVNEAEHKVTSSLFDSISNIKTVITLRLEERMQTDLLQKVDNILPPFMRNIRLNEWKWFTVDMLVGVVYAVVLVGYVYDNYVPGQIFLIGNLVILVGYVQKFTSVFHGVAWLYTSIVRHHTDVSTAMRIIDAYDGMYGEDGGTEYSVDWDDVVIKSLSFQHKQEDVVQSEHGSGLEQLDIALPAGNKIAIIGESGSGKSTLLTLLRGLFPAHTVNLSVGGEFYDSLDKLAANATLLPQEPEIFENTIRYNITLGLEHTEADLNTVIRIAHLTDVIKKLPKGVESNIREKGVNLSGGEKQRLALARGIFAAAQSNLVLLDEPTSSIDPKTELEIYKRLFSHFEGKTVVSALHRLHLLPLFDRIYILHNGKKIGEGHFTELVAGNPHFQEMWNHQLEVTMP